MDRDPILAHVMTRMDLRWNSEDDEVLEAPGNEEKGFPDVWVSKLDHRLIWTRSNVTLIQRWIDPEKNWKTTIEIERLPDQLQMALVGKNLREIIDIDGAEAWVIKKYREVSMNRLILHLERT